MYIEEKPYVSVTGINEKGALLKVAEYCHEVGLDDPENTYQGMIGHLVSLRSLSGLEFSRGRYPSVDSLAGLIKATEGRVKNAIHYYTSEPASIHKQVGPLLASLSEQEAPVDALQLNIAWPPLNEVEAIKRDHPDLRLILQVGPNILRSDDAVVQIAQNLPRYQDVVDYLLVDPSGGKGFELMPRDLMREHYAIRLVMPDVTLICAGGLDNLNVVSKIREVRQFWGERHFGVDAENGLRVRTRFGTMPNMSRVHNFIDSAANELLKAA